MAGKEFCSPLPAQAGRQALRREPKPQPSQKPNPAGARGAQPTVLAAAFPTGCGLRSHGERQHRHPNAISDGWKTMARAARWPPSPWCRWPRVPVRALPVGLLESPTCVSILLFASLSRCCRCLYLFAGCRSPSRHAAEKKTTQKPQKSISSKGPASPEHPRCVGCRSCLCPLSRSFGSKLPSVGLAVAPAGARGHGGHGGPWGHSGKHDFGGGEQPG